MFLETVGIRRFRSIDSLVLQSRGQTLFWFFIPVEKPRTKSDPLAKRTPWPNEV